MTVGTRAGAPSLILDLFDMYGMGSVTLNELETLCTAHRPDLTPAAVRRAVWRLVAAGLLRSSRSYPCAVFERTQQ